MYYCPECGSRRLQVLAWVDLNSPDDGFCDWQDSASDDDYYCEACYAHARPTIDRREAAAARLAKRRECAA